jgi:hypothetical protein
LEEDVDRALPETGADAGMSHRDQGEEGWREHVFEEPPRTPGQAEGSEEDVDRTLSERPPSDTEHSGG